MKEVSQPKLGLEELQSIVDRSPFNRWVGMRAESITADGVVLTIRWREELISNPVLMATHGGILAALIDGAADYAVAALVGHAVPTLNLQVDYHRTATPGDLRAKASIIHLGGTLATAQARVFDSNGRLVASGRGMYMAGELTTKKGS